MYYSYIYSYIYGYLYGLHLWVTCCLTESVHISYFLPYECDHMSYILSQSSFRKNQKTFKNIPLASRDDVTSLSDVRGTKHLLVSQSETSSLVNACSNAE